MTVFEKLTELPELTGVAAEQVSEDMALIARARKLDLPRRRLRVLIDYELVEIVTLALLGGSLRGSRTSLGWSEKGAQFMCG